MTPVVTGLRLGRRRDLSVAVVPTPAVSWTVEGPPGWRPERAQLRLDDGEERMLDAGSVLVRWPFAPLIDGAAHTLAVRVQGDDGRWTAWSPLPFAVHLADGSWDRGMLAHPAPDGEAATMHLRREVHVPADVVSATVASTGHGVHQVAIDGVDVDDHVLKPGWTSYRDRLPLTVTDATATLTPGVHALTVRAAGGWFTERYGFGANATRVYGDQPAVSVRLRLMHTDGRVTELDDTAWRVDPAPPLVASGLYAGERRDLRQESAGWLLPGFDDAAWPPASVLPLPPGVRVELLDVEPVRRVAEVAPVSLQARPGGRTLIDFGQNLVGRVRLRLDLPEGAEVVIRHAEVLDGDELCTWPLRAAEATDRIVGDGAGPREFEPEFTFHGFRYAEVSGVEHPLDPADVRAIVLGTDVRRNGWFASSDPLLDRLHENVVWSLRGNLLAVPTDCPQRDERLGWTGDAQVFAAAAASIFDVDALYGAWLDDLALEQRALDGVVPTVVPNPLGAFAEVAAAGWGDAVTIVPNLLRERYGDDGVRTRLAPAMGAWVAACESLADAGGLWERGFQYGDWLDPTSARPDKAKADPGLVAGAFRVASARLAADALRAAGDEAGADEAARIAGLAAAAFGRAYLTAEGRLMSDAPSAYALVLALDLLPADLRGAMAERLAFLLRAGGYRMATGFLGTPVVLDALLDNGQEHAAEQLLFQTMCPSWLYPVTQGATTMWERWDAVRPDGTLHPSGMVSLNHCAFGAVADVLHRRIGGLAPAAPGYRRLRVHPWFPSRLAHAEVRHETPYGLARVAWRRDGDRVIVTAEVPTGTDAEVVLPGRAPFEVGSGTHEWVVEVGSGAVHPSARGAELAGGVDTDLAVLADSPGVCALVSGVLAEHSPAMATEFDAYIRWVPGRALRPELAAVAAPADVVSRIDAALRGPLPA
ncbi:family 78 glycoside hydrolase catalytic domain [uncultured Microbacterium sp.]|uniref:family 78 glycoside hydrolase catalytic domain n=1 Tax=uncultured Microbacterium sp. TaxID=191216 RepID=UPI0028DC2A3C|nr:family 78 glycoside hydrolase catalytic domain [uncultured Microbacterium sp.]